MVQIPVVMTTDNNYVIQTSVTILSILDNKASNTEYTFYILNNGTLTEDSRLLMEKAACSDVSRVNYLIVSDSLFKEATVANNISVSSYYRLLISELLPNIDKCIFIDGDTIVKADIAELFFTNLENYYVAGVRDCGVQYRFFDYKGYHEKLGIPDMKDYINAGVLVLNLCQIRRDGMVNIFMNKMEKKYLMMDQDVINASCYGRIKHLPLEYNVFSEFGKNQDKLQGTYFTSREIENAKQKVKIVHYAGTYKPWNNIRSSCAREWWEYAERILDKRAYHMLYEKAFYESKERDWSYMKSKCSDCNGIIIFGYSKIGKELYDALRRNGIQNILAFCDNDVQKQGEVYQGIPVISVESALENSSSVFIISSQRFYKAIESQLIHMGVDEWKIIRYFVKNQAYYHNLSELYYDKEAEEWSMFHYGKMENEHDKGNALKEIIAWGK